MDKFVNIFGEAHIENNGLNLFQMLIINSKTVENDLYNEMMVTG